MQLDMAVPTAFMAEKSLTEGTFERHTVTMYLVEKEIPFLPNGKCMQRFQGDNSPLTIIKQNIHVVSP